MLKPDLLRAALVAALPEYAVDADRLLIFIESGRIATRFAPPNYNFEYRYKAKVMLLDFVGHVDQVVLPLIKWITVHQPEILQSRDTANQALAFEAEVLSGSKVDISFVLNLTEAVRLITRDDGGLDLEHLAEPTLENDFEGVAPGVRLAEIWRDGTLIVPA